MSDLLRLYDIKTMAARLGRPQYTLLAQGPDNDPFHAGMESRRLRAEWFKRQWDRLDIQPGAHLRRIHYRLVTTTAVLLPRVIGWNDPETRERVETETYLNNSACWAFLGNAAADARYLGLIPIGHIVDAR